MTKRVTWKFETKSYIDYVPIVECWQWKMSHSCHHSHHMMFLDQKCMFCLAWMLQCCGHCSSWVPHWTSIPWKKRSIISHLYMCIVTTTSVDQLHTFFLKCPCILNAILPLLFCCFNCCLIFNANFPMKRVTNFYIVVLDNTCFHLTLVGF